MNPNDIYKLRLEGGNIDTASNFQEEKPVVLKMWYKPLHNK